jgi:prepilin-type N-terminal cleavage/methylation domain-containing protein
MLTSPTLTSNRNSTPSGRGAAGFTLVELIVAVSILGVLAGVVLLNLGTFFGSGRAEAMAVEHHQVAGAVTGYCVDGHAITQPFTVGPGNNMGPGGELGPYLSGSLSYKWLIAADGSVSRVLATIGDSNAGYQYLVFSQSGNVLDGNMYNAVWVNGLTGEAITFNGVNSFVSVPNSAAFNPTTQVSMEAWVYSGEQKTAKIIEKGDWDGQGLGQDKWQGWQADIVTASGQKYSVDWGQGRPALNTWYHVAYTYDGSNLRIYVNGVECNSTAVSGNLKVNARAVTLGSDGGNQKFFNGTIDQARMYNSALTAEQILAHYDALKP